jgi:hypothetical protein
VPQSFSSVTWGQLQSELALRLNDVNHVRWTAAENKLYLAEALRLWNALTQTYVLDFVKTYTQPNPATLPVWQSLGNGVNTLVGNNPTSPRYQTLTDSDVYKYIQYHFLEPPNGNATWTGTSQFSLTDFVNAFTRRRDQILQITACNVGPFSPTLSLAPGTNQVQLPDSPSQTILDVRRIRYVPVQGNPKTLYQDDSLAMAYFQNNFLQTNGTPLSWDVLGSQPQILSFDAMPNVPNNLDCLAVISGGTVTPPTASPLLIPDDFFWVLKYGMMADLLSKETESKDLMRAAYCEQRFTEGVRLMMEMPWCLQARLNNIPVDTPSFYEADNYSYEWESDPNAPAQIVRGGIDLFAISPLIPAGGTVSVDLSLVANMPIPAADGDYVQISRECLVYILDEAEHLAQIKEGGSEFQESIALHQRFVKGAMDTNRRLLESGIFPTDLRRPISKEDEAEPRYALEANSAQR